MSSQANGSSDEALERLYMGAMAAAKAGRLEEAAEMLDQMMTLDPNFPDAWWNLGTFRAQLNQHGPALSVWDIYRRMVPDDWRARVKVIQSCQALGDMVRRDRERNELLALRRAGADPTLSAEPRYCREQFRVGEQAVVAYEIFEPSGPTRVFYQFMVGAPATGEYVGHYSLGSYDFTTEFQREMGSIGPDDRVYHLDWYAGPLHSTVCFYHALPGYDETRAHVVAAMTGSFPPVSGISTSPETGKANVPGYGGGSSPPPPPSPATPDATRVATGGGAGRTGGGSGSEAGPWERLLSRAARLLGRRGDRAN